MTQASVISCFLQKGIVLRLTLENVFLGNYNYSHLIPSEEFNLPNLTPFLHGEDKRLFIEFVLQMLRWEPERQLSAKQLYNDPWLHHNS